MIALSNAMYINLGLQINDKAEKICIFGNTIGFFGAVVNNKLSLSDSNPDTISNNLCWLINECRKNSEIMIIGNADIYKYYKIIFKWIGDSLQKRINWSSVNITKIIKNLSNFEEFEDNVDRSYIKVLEELYNKKLKFTKIIMNPPYDGNFHLKLVSTAMRLSDDIINLSPIRWLQDPLAEYKNNSDWNKFEDIRGKIENIDIVSEKDAFDFFNIYVDTLGIYTIKKDAKGYTTDFSKTKRLLKNCKTFYKDFMNKAETEYKVPVAKYHWKSNGDKDFEPFSLMLTENGTYAKTGWTKGLHDTYEMFYFDTEDELKNFKAFLQLKSYKWVLGQLFIGKRLPTEFIPFMPTYAHPWTDEMLYDFFGLTPKERDEIDKEIEC